MEELPEDISDDNDTPLKDIAKRQQRITKQGESEAVLGQTPGDTGKGGDGDGDDGDNEWEEEEDDDDMSESEIQALQAKQMTRTGREM